MLSTMGKACVVGFLAAVLVAAVSMTLAAPSSQASPPAIGAAQEKERKLEEYIDEKVRNLGDIASACPGPVNLFLTASSVETGKPAFANVRVTGYVRMVGSNLLWVKQGEKVWLVNASQVVAIERLSEETPGPH